MKRCVHCGDAAECYGPDGEQCCRDCYDELANGVIKIPDNIGLGRPTPREETSPSWENVTRMIEDFRYDQG